MRRWLIALVGVAATAIAADPPPAQTPSAPATTPATTKPVDPSKPTDPAKPAVDNKSPTDAKAPAAQKPAGDTKPPTKDPNTPSTPQRFVPSEQVRPDFDVSFPVDI
jgi:hypothetical protein